MNNESIGVSNTLAHVPIIINSFMAEVPSIKKPVHFVISLFWKVKKEKR